MFIKKSFYLFLSTSVLFFSSCDSDLNNPIEDAEQSEISTISDTDGGIELVNNSSLDDTTIELYIDFLNDIGITNTTVILKQDELTIDGDMVVSYADIQRELKQSSDPTSKQRATNSSYSSVFNNSILYYIDPNAGIPNNWQLAFREATQEWEDLIGTDIRFTETFNRNSARLKLTSFNEAPVDGAGIIATGNLPTNRNSIGNTISVNINALILNFSTNQNQRQSTMMHEIGHTVGFQHTNGDTFDADTTNERLGFLGSLVRCTDNNDVQSIMSRTNQRVAGQTIPGRDRDNPIFTDRDRIAILGLFRSTNPIITQVNGTKNVNQEGRLLVRWDRTRITSSQVRVTIFDKLFTNSALTYLTNNDGYDDSRRAIDLRNSGIPGYINRDNYYFGCLNVQIQNATTGEIMDITEAITFQFQSSGGGGGGGSTRPGDTR